MAPERVCTVIGKSCVDKGRLSVIFPYESYLIFFPDCFITHV